MKFPGKSLTSLTATAFVFLFLLATEVQAQLEVFNEHRVQPEAWHFPGPQEPGVGSGGDLSLSIPLMTVPGRGMSYDITLGYQSGITVEQRASWVGTGWSMGLPVITRDIEGGAWHDLVPGAPFFFSHGVDAWDDSMLPREQPDLFFVTLPGSGTVEVTQSNIDFDFGTIPESTENSFIPNDHIPWKIDAYTSGDIEWETAPSGNPIMTNNNFCRGATNDPSTGITLQTGEAHYGNTSTFTVKEDIAQFVVKAEDGSRYVFAEPTLSYYQKRRDANERDEFGLTPETRQMYVNTWRLVAILGPDVTIDVPIPTGNTWQTVLDNWLANLDNTPGSWIRFEYEEPVTACKTPDTTQYPIPAVEVTQAQYLARIITPTHRAEFITDVKISPYTRAFHEVSAPMLQRRLKKIELYNRIDNNNNVLVERVELDQANTIAAGALAPQALQPNTFGRLKLKGLNFFNGSGDNRPGYTFGYSNPPGALDHTVDNLGCRDDFGYLNNDPTGCQPGFTVAVDGAAWSLGEITYPTGATDKIVYETDIIADDTVPYERAEFGVVGGLYEIDSTYTDYYYFSAQHRIRQGGPRVMTIERYPNGEAAGNPLTTTYDYGPGHINGVPPEYWAEKAQDIMNPYGSNTRGNLFKPSKRGRTAVFYEYVTKELPDHGKIKTYYTTPAYSPYPTLGYYPIQPIQTLLMAGNLCGESFGDCVDVAVIQGRSVWQWGVPYKTEVSAYIEGEDVPVSVTESSISSPWPGNEILLANAFQWSEPDPDPNQDPVAKSIPIYFGSLRSRSDKTTTYDYEGNSLEQTTSYEYDSKTGLRKKTTAQGSGVYRRTETTYAYELDFEPYASMKNRNMLTQTAAQEISTSSSYHAASATKWADVGSNRYKPQATYTWNTTSPSTTSPVTGFNWSSTPGSDWQLDASFQSYDAHGNLTQQVDALGTTTSFFYGDNNNIYSQDTDFKNAYLTGVRRSALEIGLKYDPTLMLVNEAIDESGASTRYEYDDFGRLIEVYDATNENIASYCYHWINKSDACLDPSEPNAVVSTTDLGGGNQVVSRAYFDGLGRSIQTQVNNGNNDIVTATEYDPSTGRPWRAYKPYEWDQSGGNRHHYDPNYASRADAHYNGQFGNPDANGAPYTETLYWDDPRDRVKEIIAEGNSGVIKQNYGVENVNSKWLTFTETIDEDNKITRAYTDVLGNQVRTEAGIGSAETAITEMEYDILGNVVAVKPPNFTCSGSQEGCDNPGNTNWITNYTYNTRGLLIAKDTPDADAPFNYAYDARGNLRAVKDPNHSSGGFLYTNYDEFDRVTETGVCSNAAFPNHIINAPEACPGTKTERVVYTYDAYDDIDESIAPKVNASNAQSRLTRVAFDEETSYFQYFYDDNGRIVDYFVYLDGFGGKLVEYEYDLQGNVTKISYQDDLPDADAFYHWYTYDNVGRLKTVKTNITDNESSAVQDANYASYAATSQVKQLHLGNVQTVDYEYHIRDWLTAINNINALGNDAFAMRLGYNEAAFTDAPTYKNGNVGSVKWSGRSNTGGARPAVGYSFVYDDLNRLKGATFDALGSGAPSYSVPNVAYDPNGNIMLLSRHNPDFTENAINYQYQTGTNRLLSTSGAVAASFLYDANGNMTKSRVASSILHDHRNLPTGMTLTNNDTLDFHYDANGQRVLKELMNADGTIRTHYVRDESGRVLAVYEDAGSGPLLLHWNILSGGGVIGRLAPSWGSPN